VLVLTVVPGCDFPVAVNSTAYFQGTCTMLTEVIAESWISRLTPQGIPFINVSNPTDRRTDQLRQKRNLFGEVCTFVLVQCGTDVMCNNYSVLLDYLLMVNKYSFDELGMHCV